MIQGTLALDVMKTFSARTSSQVVSCPRCGTIWAKRKGIELLGQNCPICHGYKRVVPARW